MADWTTPAITSNYVDVLAMLKDRDVDLAKMFDDVTASNIPTGAIKWLVTSSKLQKYNGVSWDDQVVSVAGGGTGAATPSAARTNLGLGTISTQNADAVAITGGSIAAAISVASNALRIKDASDATKIAQFNVSAITTATTASYSLPPASTTLVGIDSTQTLTNKTLTDCVVNTQVAGDNTTKAASTAFVTAATPPGIVWPFAGSVAPSGFLLCYGQAISRTAFARLYSVIGTTFGAGDGTTTFNVPDLRGRVVAGVGNMGGTEAGRLSSYMGSGLGGAAGAQAQQFALSGSGTAFTNGLGGTAFTSGIATSDSTGFATNIVGGGGFGYGNVAGPHIHLVQDHASIQVSGNASVSISGVTDVRHIIQPTMQLNYVIKY